ncbi:zinc-dependent alcohol dehydrogenase family protein [Nocardioides bigeumensis]|uniref:alcohol dehydrogenase n=1 Tax=Nocardioides bigeumensis TaxID=433657 RepID=A0ABN2Y7Z5_9ACTN
MTAEPWRAMPAWAVEAAGPLDTGPLQCLHRPVPAPAPHELLVQVSACGVCRTDVHLALGELPPRRPGVVPGHQVVGRVESVGHDVTGWAVRDRVGVAWLAGTCGSCRWCLDGRENLCASSTYRGWDVDGGFAPYAVAHADYAYKLPQGLGDVSVAPLLCAGIIGYRALRRTNLPPGGRLGIYGFGSSGHLTAQVAMHQGAVVHVMTRGERARVLARELGVASVGGATATPPEPLDAAIVFAPAGELVPLALTAVDAGGTVVLAGIHMSQIPPLDYTSHLFRERDLRTVTANTRADGEQLLEIAAAMDLDVRTTAYPFFAVPDALRDIESGAVAGSAVIDLAGHHERRAGS